jgi:hypothetical protein
MLLRGWLVLFAFLAAPIYAQNATAPSVTLNGTGTVVGVTDLTTRLDTFLGIHYAQPPIGDLRFAAPKALSNEPSRVIRATKYGPVCPQQPSVNVSPPNLFNILTRFCIESGGFSYLEHV